MRGAIKGVQDAKSFSNKSLHLVGQRSAVDDLFKNQTSTQAQRMRSDLDRVARTSFNILITGETGTGKTRMARQIHRLSSRSSKPFIELNCANLPEHLVEAELFGHRKGAFTGADYERKGLFEEAHGGILFLDEIGDIPVPVQNRLLRAIEEKQIKRLGTNRYESFDVQIIAATSRLLIEMVHSQEFREDLYCRLAVLTIEASPLRERRDDIPMLIKRFLIEAAELNHRQSNYLIDDEALVFLGTCDYPGNIRSLRNLIYELTTYIEDEYPIALDLVLKVLRNHSISIHNSYQSKSTQSTRSDFSSVLERMANEGDIVLPIELCILKSGETFKQWTARAKRYSIEATRNAIGGDSVTAAERLGLTHESLKSHLHRARRVHGEPLFD